LGGACRFSSGGSLPPLGGCKNITEFSGGTTDFHTPFISFLNSLFLLTRFLRLLYFIQLLVFGRPRLHPEQERFFRAGTIFSSWFFSKMWPSGVLIGARTSNLSVAGQTYLHIAPTSQCIECIEFIYLVQIYPVGLILCFYIVTVFRLLEMVNLMCGWGSNTKAFRKTFC